LKVKILKEFIIIDLLAFLLVIFVIFTPSPAARIIIGLPILLFFPGYTLAAALFAKKREIVIVEWVALSIGMSIAISSIIGFGLNYTSWGLKVEYVIYSLTVFTFITSIVALIRRARIKTTYIFVRKFNVGLPAWGEGKFNKLLSILLIVVLVAAVGMIGFMVSVPKIGEKYSEFYILGLDGQTQNYPTDYVKDNGKITLVFYSQGTMDAKSGFGVITVGIINHEQEKVNYYVKMKIDGEPTPINSGGIVADALGPIELPAGQKWENSIFIVPQHVKDNQKVELSLFKGLTDQPEYSVHLWINVKSANTTALSSLDIKPGTLAPGFTPDNGEYSVSVDNNVDSLAIMPVANDDFFMITVNGNLVDKNKPSQEINLNSGDNTIMIKVTGEDNSIKTYKIVVTRKPLS
jgi:uncharacterized membrane protein